MRTYVYCKDATRRGSMAKKVARSLGLRVVDPQVRPATRLPVQLINWGCSEPPRWGNELHWLTNTPEHVHTAAHKLRCLRHLSEQGIDTLEFTSDRDEALRWFNEGNRIYARTVLQGHSGDGLVFLDPNVHNPDDIVIAPLYTRDFGTPFKEYRIHVAFGDVIDMAMKKRMSEDVARARGIALPDERTRLQVRVYANGWTFAHHDILDHDVIRDCAIRTAAALNNMPLVAVDLAVKWRRGTPREIAVIEVNSAPALRAPTTVNAYTTMLRGLINA